MWTTQIFILVACLAAEEAKLYELKQPRDLFNQLRKQENIRAWPGDQYDTGQSAYFITGYRTLLDTAEWKKKINKTDGKVEGSVTIKLGIFLGAAAPAMFEYGYEVSREQPGDVSSRSS